MCVVCVWVRGGGKKKKEREGEEERRLEDRKESRVKCSIVFSQ